MSTVAGNTSGAVGTNNYGHSDGVATAASFYYPWDLAIDGAGTFAVVVSGGEATVLSSTQTYAFKAHLIQHTPLQADLYNNLIRLVNLSNSLVTTVVGNLSGVGVHNYGHADGVGSSASFFLPIGIAMDAAGSFVIVVSAHGMWYACMVWTTRYILFACCRRTNLTIFCGMCQSQHAHLHP